MKIFMGIAEAADAARIWLIIHSAELPEHVADRLNGRTQLGNSPVDLIVDFTEAVFANRDDFSDDAKDIAAACASLIDRDGYQGRLDGRANGIHMALRRETGAPGEWPDASADPEPKLDFATSSAAATPPVPAA